LSTSADVKGILGEATGLERRYEWLEASGLYEQALRLVDEEDYFRRGEIQEKIGHCLHRAAFQAGSREEFLEEMRGAVEASERAHGLYGKLGYEQRDAWMSRCGAIAKYREHWIASDMSEKKMFLDECLELEERALESYLELGNKLEYCRTFNELSDASSIRAKLEWDRQVRKGLIERAIEWGERAVAALTELGDSYETARALSTLSGFLNEFCPAFVAEMEEQERYETRCIELFRKAVELSESAGDAYTAGVSHLLLGYFVSRWSPQDRGYLEKAMECGEKTRDNYLKARTLDWLSYSVYWEAIAIEDPDQRSELLKKAMGFYDEAHYHYSIIFYKIPRRGKIGALPPGGYAEYYSDKARWETELTRKHELLDKSESAGLKALKMAEELDIPIAICRTSHILSRTLAARARLEPDVDVRRGLLEEAMKHRERNLEIYEQLYPFHYWNTGAYNNLLADIKAELAHIQPVLDNKRRLLEDAVKTKEKSLKDLKTDALWSERKGNLQYFASLSRYQDSYGEMLTRLYEVTSSLEHLRRAIEVWWKAIVSARKLEMVTRIAESYWKTAKAHATLEERPKAAESFKRASESYEEAAENIPQLKEFYQEYASYMLAWSEFEKAKHSHAEKRYMEAKEHYEKAAELHRSTERWSYLAPNYLAWARLEEAEDLSRMEQTEEASELFRQANDLFKEAKGTIEIKLDKIQDEEERKLLVSLAQASDIRRDYCFGRIALEEGKILDRQGDHLASSDRYGQAVERFQKVIDAMERELDQRELRPIIYLSRAWQRMMMAEEQMSSSLYQEAAELFMEAREHALDQTTRLLAQAHSSFCKALGAGTEFEITRKTDLFSEAKRHIEAATSHYLRAGHKTRSDYARATGRLLDAYLYTYNAQTESDPKRRAQFYQMAERLLQSSAGAYLKAKHPEKSDEIRRVLESVKEEREIAVSLSEVLHASTIVSTTASFSTPTPTHEQAVGLERFENADIQANLILGGREVKVGDDIDIEIELVNAGKAPAQLIKVEEIIPKGFEVTSAPDICRVEDSYLDMKGRTLNPLKTAELKIVLKPINKGTFDLRPRILYLDEAGRYRSHEPEPATVVVKELGIKGWLRGPTR